MCYSLRVSLNPSTPNAIEWHHDYPGPALSQLSRDRHSPTWPDPSRQATVPLPRVTCAGRTFLLDYSYPGQSPEVKQQIVEMALNASGIRDTARVLHVSTNTVMTELKKAPSLQQVNQTILQVLYPEHVEVELCRSEELDRRRGLTSEPDEMWSYVRSKAYPRWLWHAIDYHTGKVLGYVFGQRKDEVFLGLQELLKPFGITKFYTDGWGAYERHLDAEQHHGGKENTQTIESKHINRHYRK